MDEHNDRERVAFLREVADALRVQWHKHCGAQDPEEDWDAADFDLLDQLLRGRFPVKVPISVELFMDRDVVYLRVNSPDQPPAGQLRRTLNVLVPYDRMRLRDTFVKWVESRRDESESILSTLYFLALTHRESFLDTAAKHFAEILAHDDGRLGGDGRFVVFLMRLREYDTELIVELVERLMGARPSAGRRLRDAVLEAIDRPRVRDEIGWLAAAELAERLEGL
jgi:hypothetical protein